jgi:hypothetical protein
MCDNFSKSASFEQPTDDAQFIFDEAMNLLKSYHFQAADIRGILLGYRIYKLNVHSNIFLFIAGLGIQIQKLDNDIGKNPIEGTSNFYT